MRPASVCSENDEAYSKYDISRSDSQGISRWSGTTERLAIAGDPLLWDRRRPLGADF